MGQRPIGERCLVFFSAAAAAVSAEEAVGTAYDTANRAGKPAGGAPKHIRAIAVILGIVGGSAFDSVTAARAA